MSKTFVFSAVLWYSSICKNIDFSYQSIRFRTSPNLFDKGEEKNIINLKQCAELLQVLKTRIKNVEIYYNPYTTKLEGEIEGAKIFNIITQEEV